MSIDIEKLLEEIDEDGSGEIEFDEFELLLKSDYTDELPGDYDEDAEWLKYEIFLVGDWLNNFSF